MNHFEDFQQALAASLHAKYSDTVYNLWFKDIVVEEIESTHVTLSVIFPFKKNTLEVHYKETVLACLQDILGFPIDVRFTVRNVDLEEHRQKSGMEPDPEEIEEEKKAEKEKEEMTRKIEGKDLVKGYTFDNFIVGDSNRFAHAACLAVANSFSDDEDFLTDPLEEKYNPLFIYGPSGLGKTHLLYAITNEIKKRAPGTKITYIRGEDFLNELVDCLSKKTTADFRKKYRETDVLLIDDVHFIAGKTAVQEEFFNTFNTLYESQKQIILTSDRPSREIEHLTDRLRTRFEWGLSADIQPPDAELRAAIIKHKAQRAGITIPQEIVEYMAEKIKDNIRTIEGAIRKLSAMNLLTGIPITLESTRRAIADIQSITPESTYIVEGIFREVSGRYKVPVDTIKGNRRQANIILARHLCMYLLRSMTDFPLAYIGSIFDCNHTNVISACNKIENRIDTDPAFKGEVEEIKAAINKRD